MFKHYLKKKIDVAILCGGIGSRIKKYSKGVPKSLIKINEKNIIIYILNELKKYNFNKIYLLTGYKSELFKHFDKIKLNFIPVERIIEKKSMGTGGALISLKKKKINDFILLNGDSILDINYSELINLNSGEIGTISLTKNINYLSNKKLSSLFLRRKTVGFNDKKNTNGGVYFLKKY